MSTASRATPAVHSTADRIPTEFLTYWTAKESPGAQRVQRLFRKIFK
ncbi:MAG: hypothetical protein JWM79_2476, partial [Nocardioides sp.]|nr:hypothetical protein [Nocardioides sp.]